MENKTIIVDQMYRSDSEEFNPNKSKFNEYENIEMFPQEQVKDTSQRYETSYL
jgi:hypothetical protein